jgi:hypothetical protein
MCSQVCFLCESDFDCSYKDMQDWILECHKKHKLVDFDR